MFVLFFILLIGGVVSAVIIRQKEGARKIFVASIAVAIFGFIGAGIAAGNDDVEIVEEPSPEIDVASDGKGEKDEDIPEETIDDEARIKEVVEKVVGEERINRYEYLDLGEYYVLSLEIEARDNLTSEMIRKGILNEAEKLLEALESDGKFYADIVVTWKMGEAKALSFTIDRDEFKDARNFDNIERIAESYWESPAF